MSNMKCPICQHELFYTYQEDGILPNPNKGKVDTIFCDNCKMYGNETIWKRIDRTRKALEIAKDTIRHADWFFDGDYNVDAKTMHNEIKCAIKGITALEQKE